MIEKIKTELIERLEKASYPHANGGDWMAVDRDTATSIVEGVFDEYNNGWIPVSEPPEIGERVLVTVMDENGESYVETDHLDESGKWFLYDSIDGLTVIAWQPSPEPYIPDKEIPCADKECPYQTGNCAVEGCGGYVAESEE